MKKTKKITLDSRNGPNNEVEYNPSPPKIEYIMNNIIEIGYIPHLLAFPHAYIWLPSLFYHGIPYFIYQMKSINICVTYSKHVYIWGM